MPVLGDATVVIARVTRSTSNALRVQLATPDGTELAHARQKNGLGVLLGVKNGGKSDYTLSNAAGDELRIAVAGTTTITKLNTPVGKIAPADGAARFETGGGTVLAVVKPHTGSKADSAWRHRILSPRRRRTRCPHADDGAQRMARRHRRNHSMAAQPIRRHLESTVGRGIARAPRASRSRVWRHIGRGVR